MCTLFGAQGELRPLFDRSNEPHCYPYLEPFRRVHVSSNASQGRYLARSNGFEPVTFSFLYK